MTSEVTTSHQKTKNGNQAMSKRSLWAMMVIFILPLVVAMILYQLRDHWDISTTNYGAFINPPLDIGDFHAVDSALGDIHADTFAGKWLLVFVDSGNNESNSDLAVQKLESVYFSLGKEVGNVRPLLIAKQPPKTSPEHPFAIEHRYIHTAIANTAELGMMQDHFYIADPTGRLILNYDKEAQSNGILRDLRKLLKVSNG